MADSSPRSRVLRVAVIVDELVCDELHQEAAGPVQVGSDVGNTITLHGKQRLRSQRSLAPVWLALAAALILGGGAWFATQLAGEARFAAETVAANPLGIAPPHEGTGGLGFLVALLGLVPLFQGLYALGDRPSRIMGRGALIPERHQMFDYRGGQYFLDLPPNVRGKISLGKKAYTVSELRKKFGGRSNLRLELGAKAKGKLLLGETTILFQFAPPKPVPKKAPFPVEFRPRLDHMVSREDAASLASVALVLGSYFTWAANSEVDNTFSVDEIDERFLRVMGITVEPEEPEEAPEEEMLAQEEEDEVEEEKEEEKKPEPKDKPEKFSEAAMQKARGVGVARVLGTYGGDGPGTVSDVISDTENNLGELFAQGMTTTVLADGGDISPFVPGGDGISAHGAMAANEGLQTGEGPELDTEIKREKKIRGKLKNVGTDVFGDVDKKAVQATISRRMSALQHCYEKALRTQPSLQGKMTYTIEISVMGSVTRVVIEEDTVGSPAVTACTKGKIKGWRFPTQGAEEPAEVTFSVVFSGGA
jgi:hypothetical protein